jgi:hypothetical protein
MPARRFNPWALMLCLVVVLTLGYAIVLSTNPWPDQEQLVHESSAPLRMTDLAPAQVQMVPDLPPPVDVDYRPGPAAGPRIEPTAAPGVAFNYLYAFQLPAERIAEVQEQHANACERLGIHRCRITGMHYRVLNDRDIEATLALKLEPGLARRFGRAGIEAIARADGILIESQISGVDADASIRSASRDIAQLRDDLARVEARLGQRLSAEERSRREDEAQQLRRSIRGAEAGREEQQDSLASTPLVFRYGSGAIAAAPSRPTVAAATERAFGNFAEGMTILLILLVTLLPWALLALLAWWIVRRLRRRFDWRWSSGEPALQPA